MFSVFLHTFIQDLVIPCLLSNAYIDYGTINATIKIKGIWQAIFNVNVYLLLLFASILPEYQLSSLLTPHPDTAIIPISSTLFDLLLVIHTINIATLEGIPFQWTIIFFFENVVNMNQDY